MVGKRGGEEKGEEGREEEKDVREVRLQEERHERHLCKKGNSDLGRRGGGEAMGNQTQMGRSGQELSGVVSPGEEDRLFIVAEGVDGQRTSLFGIRKL